MKVKMANSIRTTSFLYRRKLIESVTVGFGNQRLPVLLPWTGTQMYVHTTGARPTSEDAKGEVFDKKPAKVELTEGKQYPWCTCGRSSKQPFCDGSHKHITGPVKFRPIRFKVEATKEYFLCNCKQTNKQPFCDGTHKTLA